MLASLLRDESGATALEYGLVAALVSAVMITGLMAVGTRLNTLFLGIASRL